MAFALCAMAPAYSVLLAARVLQGIGAPPTIGYGPALATNLFPEAMRVRALAVYATGFAASQALGLLLGSILAQTPDWRGIYVFQAPIALIALWLARPVPAASAEVAFTVTPDFVDGRSASQKPYT